MNKHTNIYLKQIRITVRWMPSHLKEGKKKRPNGVSDLDIEANDKADELAGIAATNCQVPKPATTNHLHYVNLVKIIQERITTILLHFPRREYVQEQKEAKYELMRSNWLRFLSMRLGSRGIGIIAWTA